MKHLKVNVGRKRLSSEYIQSKQDFAHVLKGAKAPKNTATFGKSFWFYGVTGLASLAAIVGYQFLNSNHNIDETIITLEQSITPELALNNQTHISSSDIVSVASHNVYPVMETVEKTNSVTATKKVEKLKGGESMVMVVDNQLKDVDELEITEATTSKESIPTTIKSTPKKGRGMMPSISGVFNGDILFSAFKNGEIQVGESFAVKQYSIQYTSRKGDKIISVSGSQIPADVSAELESLGINQTIFITNVIAVDSNGEMIRSVAMDLNVKFN